MQVVHVGTDFACGGAARMAIDLHLQLRQSGVESFVLSLRWRSIPYLEHYSGSEEKLLAQTLAHSLLVKKKKSSLTAFFSIDVLGHDITTHPLIREADVIHLHGINGFLSSASIARLRLLNKLVVWTIHDLQPFTGGCMYAGECEGFTESCGNCPQLDEETLNYTASNLQAMSSAIATVKPIFVVLSQWALQQIGKSRAAGKSSVHCIPNGVDCDLFKPLKKIDCRAKLNLDQNAWYILFTARDIFEIRKGVAQALAILEAIRQHPLSANAVASGQMRVLCCGDNGNHFNPKGWQVDQFSYVPEDQMPLFYNSANIFLFTSLAETFGNVVPEAMACGTPVVSHRVGATPDILNEEPLSACLFEIGNTPEAVAFIIRLFQNHNFYEEISSRGIQRVIENYSLEKNAAAYQRLYSDLLLQRKLQPMPALSTPISVCEGCADALLTTVENTAASIATSRMMLQQLLNLLRRSR